MALKKQTVEKPETNIEKKALSYSLMPRRDFLDKDLIAILKEQGIERGSDTFDKLMIQLVSFCVRRDHRAWDAGFSAGKMSLR